MNQTPLRKFLILCALLTALGATVIAGSSSTQQDQEPVGKPTVQSFAGLMENWIDGVGCMVGPGVC